MDQIIVKPNDIQMQDANIYVGLLIAWTGNQTTSISNIFNSCRNENLINLTDTMNNNKS